MVTFKKGNIWRSKADAIVITTNCEGVNGAGIAKDFQKKYPYEAGYYSHFAKTYGIKPGRVLPIRAHKPFWLICFTTKDKWVDPSRLEWIAAGLAQFVAIWPTLEINSVAFPPLGCGLGKLKWKDVKPLMEQYLSQLPGEIIVYEPDA